MNRNEADLIAGGLIASILLLSILAALGSFQAAGEMTTGGWLGLAGMVLAATLGIVYMLVRHRFQDETDKPTAGAREARSAETEAPPTPDESTTPDSDDEPVDTGVAESPGPVDQDVREQLLAELPEDERKIFSPIVESPGLTQVDVRDESGFSKSKVSQTVNDLEDRGLLYRERDGRTFRIYPAEDLEEQLLTS